MDGDKIIASKAQNQKVHANITMAEYTNNFSIKL